MNALSQMAIIFPFLRLEAASAVSLQGQTQSAWSCLCLDALQLEGPSSAYSGKLIVAVDVPLMVLDHVQLTPWACLHLGQG